ncbi:MAG: DUF2235 domain-containing protein [Sphingomonas phyllosphaerae]
MKRLIFCFDGTWNKLNENTPTNVVLTAASILRTAPDGPQLIHYDEGVGTARLERWTGGIFGSGLMQNVREAYRFLIFNYDPGDEIFVFGFSRGAFSARTFVGLLRHVGPLRRLHAGRIDEAIALYEKRLKGDADAGRALREFRATYAGGVCIGAEDDAFRCQFVPGYASGEAPQLKIRYLGVWDTVAAMGVPANIWGSGWINRKHRFHDSTLDDFVESAWHAVALDERRSMFPPTLFGDLTELNAAKGKTNDDVRAPYQERWFPGVHGSVGGGGDIRGLSDGALAWILKGAKLAGLKLDTLAGTRIHAFHPDPMAPLINVKDHRKGFTDRFTTDRVGPEHMWQLSSAAQRRWVTQPAAGATTYRPASLKRIAGKLSELPTWSFTPPDDLIDTVKVGNDDTLSGLSLRFYGKSKHWREIHLANLDTIEDPDEIFPGQMVRIPRLGEEETTSSSVHPAPPS